MSCLHVATSGLTPRKGIPGKAGSGFDTARTLSHSVCWRANERASPASIRIPSSPGSQAISAKLSLDLTTQVWLVSEHSQGLRETSRSRPGQLTGARRRRPSRPSNVFLLLYSRVTALPLFHLFAFSQSLLFTFYSIVTPLRPIFNFAFLCSIYWELALIYFKPGCADHQPSLVLYFCIVNSTTFISAAATPTNSIIHIHTSSARGTVVQFRFTESAEKLYAFLTFREQQYNILSCTSSDHITSGLTYRL
ncbi:hypothetical protein BKA65DRAFT_187662 [Rhexocercosporidium sp. MPI-PUGE-AT-0058]|nr:hypothetical protein BKA65DRAFT_187662 [Rhexocercosporidium sp. MPI-PUGE-AT-0058]